jgi:hypothetical protein
MVPIGIPASRCQRRTPAHWSCLKFDNKDIDGTLIKASDKKVYIATKGVSIIPTTTDRLMIGGVSHTIVRAMLLDLAGINLYFEFQVRG